jgi:hypothetical protein
MMNTGQGLMFVYAILHHPPKTPHKRPGRPRSAGVDLSALRGVRRFDAMDAWRRRLGCPRTVELRAGGPVAEVVEPDRWHVGAISGEVAAGGSRGGSGAVAVCEQRRSALMMILDGWPPRADQGSFMARNSCKGVPSVDKE